MQKFSRILLFNDRSSLSYLLKSSKFGVRIFKNRTKMLNVFFQCFSIRFELRRGVSFAEKCKHQRTALQHIQSHRTGWLKRCKSVFRFISTIHRNFKMLLRRRRKREMELGRRVRKVLAFDHDNVGGDVFCHSKQTVRFAQIRIVNLPYLLHPSIKLFSPIVKLSRRCSKILTALTDTCHIPTTALHLVLRCTTHKPNPRGPADMASEMQFPFIRVSFLFVLQLYFSPCINLQYVCSIYRFWCK